MRLLSYVSIAIFILQALHSLLMDEYFNYPRSEMWLLIVIASALLAILHHHRVVLPDPSE